MGAKKIIRFFGVTAIVALVVLFSFGMYAYTSSKDIANSIIRLHVIANSDSKEDQALKLKVRDMAIDYIKDKFSDIKEKDLLYKKIQEDIPNINKFVKSSLVQLGSNYDARTEIGKSYFPTRDYGVLKIPAGTYDALRILIGTGKGKNWWCVLFPPLCFADATNPSSAALMDKEAAEKMLSENLSKEEYALITSSKSKDIPVKFKFKIVEMFQESKLKLSLLLEK